MSIENKKLNIVSDTNFDGNKITDAKINAQENTISNLEVSNFKSDIIQTVVRDGTYATNTSIPTEKAVSDALNNKQGKLSPGSNIFFWEHPEETFVDFSGFGFYKDHFVLGTDLILNNNRVTGFPHFRLISVGTLIFLNGKLLNLLDDYFIESADSLYLNVEVSNNDVLSIIYGLSILTKVGNQTGTTIPCDYYIDANLLVFKNGYLLKNDQYYFNNGSLVFTTALVSTDILVFVKAVTNVITQESTTGEYLDYQGPENNLVFKNGRLLALGVDYDIEEYDVYTSQGTLKFNTPLLSTDIVTFVYNEPNSIYNLLGDKLNYLPVLQSGKILSNDGFGLKWVEASAGVNVKELAEGTNIDNLREEGTFFIKNPTGTLPSSISTSGTYWCILTQEKCYDDLNLSTYWYLQTVKFSRLAMGPGAGAIESWQSYTRQITDYTYLTGNSWQRLDNVAEKVFGVDLTSSNANVTVSLSNSNGEYLTVIPVGMVYDGSIRTVNTLNLIDGVMGSCRVIFKTGSGSFSITISAYILAQLLNADILTNYSFKSNTLYDIHFQQSSNMQKYYVQVTEIDKPFVQEYFPSQSGNSGKFLTTNGSTLAWAEVQGGGSSLPDQTGQSGKFLTTNGSTASWAEVQGGSSATITYFDSTNWTLDITNTILSTGLSLGNNVNVFKNGNLLRPGATNDYTISGNDITFTDSLLSTDSIAVINGNMNPMQSVGYNTFSNKSVLVADWEVSSEYPEYGYKCSIPCTGVTSTMYAQVTFAPEEAMSGNYANICDTGTGVVTIYSKVAEAITIPMIMVLGV